MSKTTRIVMADTSGNPLGIPSMGIPPFNYIVLTQASLTDTWVYKIGGSGGTTVATIVVTFTASDKTIIDTVVKT